MENRRIEARRKEDKGLVMSIVYAVIGQAIKDNLVSQMTGQLLITKFENQV